MAKCDADDWDGTGISREAGVIEKWLYVKGKDVVIYDPSSDRCFLPRSIYRVEL